MTASATTTAMARAARWPVKAPSLTAAMLLRLARPMCRSPFSEPISAYAPTSELVLKLQRRVPMQVRLEHSFSPRRSPSAPPPDAEGCRGRASRSVPLTTDGPGGRHAPQFPAPHAHARARARGDAPDGL